MLSHYGVDVLDPRVSPRRIHSLRRRLPAGTSPDPESELSWSTEAYLMATVIDQMSALIYVTLKANGAKTAQKPVPVPRPKPRPRPPIPRPRTAADGGESGWIQLARALMAQKGTEVVVVDG
jgi:hypothetical protein